MPTWNGPIVPHSWWDAALTNTNWADSPSDPILHLRPSQARQSASLQTTTLKTIRLAALKLVANLNPASPYSPSNLDTFEWMRESYAYGSLNVYPATRPVSKDTLLAWQKEAQTRAATAGLRLAALLNKLAPEM
jgi:hypothetical protein